MESNVMSKSTKFEKEDDKNEPGWSPFYKEILEIVCDQSFIKQDFIVANHPISLI